jgi:hypothetical protein
LSAFKVNPKVRNPKIPAVNEEIKITNFELFLFLLCRFYNDRQRKRLGVVGELEFRLPITEAQ